MKNVVDTYWVKVFVAGNPTDAKRILAGECWHEGMCVTVTPTTFVYTGGMEEGVEVGLTNSPRFPTTPDKLLDRARTLAVVLRDGMYQKTALVQAQDVTEWLPRDTPKGL